MDNNHEPTGLLEIYFGFNATKILTFLVLVIGIVVVVTAIYVAVFGFDNWKSSMQQAGSLMLSDFNQPVAPGAVTGPGGGGVPLYTAPQPLTATPRVAAQFRCPNCGTVGLPNTSAGGVSLCPNCGTQMTVVGGQTGTNMKLAAAP
jgi:predicted RNA-binding Zn-ribbon protein involved in translation (DUF1610 family)